ncbi:transcription factor DIVARICATA-like [Panicum miliaceum]|uniref:Transcription factor DIVARICATA-like n=1 Tax=Panicum miliaceum TaxID=4540 RepID=A0A3L6RQC0_PANMI|nr:transcription factor DIVARICATA-like [Panicum miliaceum]
MPHDGHAAAPPPPPAPEPEPEPTWTRRDDKFLELLLVTHSIVSIHHYASGIIGKSLAQMERRCRFMFAELRHVLEALDVETPPEWDMEIAATTAAAPAAEGEAPEAATPYAPPVAAAADSALPTAVGGGGSRSEGRQVRRKKKKAEMWTPDEHRYFLAGLDKYKGNWKAMSLEYLPSRSASQIASHYQKYQNREKQRERDECRRASIHDITEPASAAAVAAAGGEAAAARRKDDGDDLPRAEASARGQEGEPRDPVQSGEPTRGDGPGAGEEFPGPDDPGTLLT